MGAENKKMYTADKKMCTENTKITREEFNSGKVTGIHTVEEPIKGFKRVDCACSFFFNKKTKTVEAIAELEMPTASTIVRSYRTLIDDNGSSHDYVNDKVRTDRAIVKNIEPRDKDFVKKIKTADMNFIFNRMFNSIDDCDCYSMYNRKFKYKKGQEVTPKHKFNDDTTVECTSGIHFFKDKDEAKNYL